MGPAKGTWLRGLVAAVGIGWVAAGQAPALAAPVDLAEVCPAGATPPAGFVDVAGDVHAGAIDCTAWWGTVRGTGAARFSPAETLRRDQLASLLARALESLGIALPPPPDDGFTDIAGNVHAVAIEQLSAIGVVAGTGERQFSPDTPVLRSQLATLLVRAYERATVDELSAGPDHFTDDDGDVHEADIDAATAAGLADGTGPGTFSPDLPLRRDQAAAFLARLLAAAVPAVAGGRLDPEPLGRTMPAGNGFDVTVVSAGREGSAVRAAMRVSNPSDTERTFDPTALRLVAPAGASYGPVSCSAPPTPLVAAAVPAGGTVEGDVCWAVDEPDDARLTVFVVPDAPAPTRWPHLALEDQGRSTVAVIGDSVPDWLLINAGPEPPAHEGVDLVDAAWAACDAAVDIPVGRDRHGTELILPPGCEEWPVAYPKAVADPARPVDTALLMIGPSVTIDRLVDGRWTSPCEDLRWYADDVAGRLAYLRSVVPDVVLVLPSWGGIGATWSIPDDHLARVTCVRDTLTAVAATAGVRIVDLADILCPAGPAGECSVYHYRDGTHVDPEDSPFVLTWLLEQALRR